MGLATAKFRKYHRKLAPILFLPLLLSTLTGIGYRIGNSWFEMPKEYGNFMMLLHEGGFLGKPLVPIYVLFTGIGLVALTVTGILMLRRFKSQQIEVKAFKKNPIRSLHRYLAPLAFLPFLVTAVTGIAYRLGDSWLSLPSEYTWRLLYVHEGAYLGSALEVYYILLLGISFVIMLITGLQMLSLFRRVPFISKK